MSEKGGLEIPNLDNIYSGEIIGCRKFPLPQTRGFSWWQVQGGGIQLARINNILKHPNLDILKHPNLDIFKHPYLDIFKHLNLDILKHHNLDIFKHPNLDIFKHPNLHFKSISRTTSS